MSICIRPQRHKNALPRRPSAAATRCSSAAMSMPSSTNAASAHNPSPLAAKTHLHTQHHSHDQAFTWAVALHMHISECLATLTVPRIHMSPLFLVKSTSMLWTLSLPLPRHPLPHIIRSTCHSVHTCWKSAIATLAPPLHNIHSGWNISVQCSLHVSSPYRRRHAWVPHLHSTTPSISDSQISCRHVIREHVARAGNHRQDWVARGHTPPSNRHQSCLLVAGAVCDAIEPHPPLQN